MEWWHNGIIALRAIVCQYLLPPVLLYSTKKNNLGFWGVFPVLAGGQPGMFFKDFVKGLGKSR
jgi:hypothetical protein